MYKRMLVPLDGSEIADIALIYTAETAAALPGVEIYLLHVYNPREGGLGSMHKAYIENATDEIGKRLDKNAAVKVKSQLVSCDPADEIVRYTQKQKTDLIIMATHGRSGISRWAYGSVAENVMLGTQTPVIMVGQQ